jgi:hypothetical protein
MFDPVKFDIAVAERNEKWIKTDEILYRICREVPHHNDLGEAIQVRPHALVKELDRYLCYLAKDKGRSASLVK